MALSMVSMFTRIVTRPAATLRRSSQLQRRFIHPSRPQLETPPRPNTWLARIRFRADGKPRSKLIALGFGSIVLFNLLFLPVLLDRVGYGGRSQSLKLLTKVIHIHRTDSTYDSVNFDDPISNLAYFKKLCTSFLQASDEEIDQFLKSFMRQIKMKTMEDSTESAEAQALHIMRSAAEAIHGAFQEINPDSFIESATFVIRVMVDALQHILDMTPDRDSDDVVSSRYSLKLMGDENDEVSNDYEGLG